MSNNPFADFTPEPWTANSYCSTHPNPDLWFAGEGELRGGTVRQVSAATRQAQSFCNQLCPVKAECLQFALTHNEAFGVYGGLTGPQRAKLTRAAA